MITNAYFLAVLFALGVFAGLWSEWSIVDQFALARRKIGPALMIGAPLIVFVQIAGLYVLGCFVKDFVMVLYRIGVMFFIMVRP